MRMTDFSSVLYTLASVAFAGVFLAPGPLLRITYVERRQAQPLSGAATIQAGMVGSWLFPGLLYAAWYIADALDIYWMEPAEPPLQRLLRMAATAAILTLSGALVAGCFLAVRRIRTDRKAR